MGSEAIGYFSSKSDRKKEKSVVSCTHEQNIICSGSYCSQTQLNDDIAHEQTIIYRQLFAGHVVGVGYEKKQKFASNDNSRNLNVV